ncbi:DMT family transporter [Thalassospira sp.]|uniref:DMT family transporter n=1 Tax=Thalassospira sp. TaxID=1912094 RepID=UPI003AA82ED4
MSQIPNAACCDTPFPQQKTNSTMSYTGLFGLVLAILIWGANWSVMKTGLEHITPLWFSSLRFLTGGLCLLVYQLAKGDVRVPRAADLPFLLSVGLLQMMLFTALGAIAMTQLSAGRSAMLSYTTAVWVAPISFFVFGERITTRKLASLLLGALGVIVLMSPAAIDWSNSAVLRANMMLLAGALCWAVCIIHLRYFRSHTSPYHLAPWQMLLAGTALLLVALMFEGRYSGDGSNTLWLALFFVGPLATAFCFCAVNLASTRLAASTTSTAMLGVPVTGILVSAIVLGEAIGSSLVFGAATIISGILISSVPLRRRKIV